MINALLIFNVLLVSVAQLTLKAGSNMIALIDKSQGLFPVIFKMILNPFLIIGTFFYVLSLVLWIYILTKAKLSFAYPVMSLSYITVMIFSFYFFKEHVNLYQWLGALLIIGGVTLMFVIKDQILPL